MVDLCDPTFKLKSRCTDTQCRLITCTGHLPSVVYPTSDDICQLILIHESLNGDSKFAETSAIYTAWFLGCSERLWGVQEASRLFFLDL